MKPKVDSRHRFMLLCGILAPIMMVAVILLVGQITPGYNPFTQTISQMGTPDSPYAYLLNGGYLIYGILITAAAYGLYQSLSLTPIAGRVATLVGVHGVFTVFLGIFPDTSDVARNMTAHVIHDIVSGLSYIPLIIGILLFRKIAKGDITLKVTGILGLIVVTASVLSPTFTNIGLLRPVTGLLQRIVALGAFSWLTLTFFLLYRKRKRFYAFDRPLALKVRKILQNNRTSLI